MMRTLLRPGNFILASLSVLHLVWGCILFFQPVQTTALALILKLCGSHYSAGAIFIAAGSMSAFSMFKQLCPVGNILLFFPQQFLLCIAAVGVIRCVADGRFADGVVHPSVFIFADQSWMIVFATLHAMAVVASQLLVKQVIILS